MKTRIQEIVISFIFCLVFTNSYSQCELDKCNPVLTGMEITPDCVAVGETSNMNLVWAMSALDNQSYCPAYSWRIKISFDAGLRYEYQSVVGEGFDWSYDAANVTLTGVNNIPMGLDIPNGIFFQGDIDVTLVGLVSNSCVPILSGANIEIIASDQGGCPQAFSNQTADDVAESAMSVSPPVIISGYVFHDYYADGTQGNNSGTGTGTDDAIANIPVTLKDCGVNNICGDTDDGPSKMTNTLADGTYEFDKLAYGNYSVCFGMDDGTTEYDEFTSQNTGADTTVDSDASSGATGGTTGIITFNAGSPTEVTDIDAGLFQYATISGTLYNNNDGTSGTDPAANTTDDIVVSYCDDPPTCSMISEITYTITTDANGEYTIDNVIPGVITAINAVTYSTFEESSVINSQTLDAHSGGSITDQNFALPVTILYFNVIKSGDISILKWATSQEINNDFFAVEHSIDGVTFDKIGSVDGNGTTYKTSTYEFEHRQPTLGNNYYRLKQYDYNGDYYYSDIKLVNFDNRVSSLRLDVYPVPSNNYIKISTNVNLVSHTISIVNGLGKRVRESVYENQMNLNISDLANGLYYVNLIDNNGYVIKQKKILKIR